MWLSDVCVTVQLVCARTGRCLKAQKLRNTRIGYCMDDDGRKLLVVGILEKEQQEWSVAGGVRMHTKFMHDGKATLTLIRRNIELLISGADPQRLMAWVQALQSGKPAAPKSSQPPTGKPKASDEPPIRPLGERSLNCPPRTPSSSPALDEKKPRSRTRPSPTWSGGSKTTARIASPVLSPGVCSLISDEQQSVLREVLRGTSIFFTGGAGTGKSFLLRALLDRLPTETTFSTATTGIAACAIGGVTLHHFAGIGNTEGKTAAEVALMAGRKRGAAWRSARVLVIDEVSMLDADLFDLLEEVARRVRNSKLPFGGLQLVLCGDFFQLPPVVKGGGSYKYAFEAASWERCVGRVFELTKVFRQRDPEFIDALQQVRLGRCPPSVAALLRECRCRAFDESDGIVATKLFTHKADCARINREQLATLEGKQYTFAARDSGSDEEALAQLRLSCPAPAELTLKVGAQVILTKTLDAGAGLVNGARGVVIKFLSMKNPVVRFERTEQTMQMERFTLSQLGRVVAVRTQFPLDYGWAISVHRSQGMSLDRVQISLARVFECGQSYVALSRARTLEGLSLLDVDFTKIRANPKVIEFHKHMTNSSTVSA